MNDDTTHKPSPGPYANWLRTGSRLRLVLAGLLFGLTVWALLQYFVLPVLFPLVSEKGFPPEWYALSFAVYGLALGILLGAVRRAQPETNHPRQAPGLPRVISAAVSVSPSCSGPPQLQVILNRPRTA